MNSWRKRSWGFKARSRLTSRRYVLLVLFLDARLARDQAPTPTKADPFLPFEIRSIDERLYCLVACGAVALLMVTNVHQRLLDGLLSSHVTYDKFDRRLGFIFHRVMTLELGMTLCHRDGRSPLKLKRLELDQRCLCFCYRLLIWKRHRLVRL